MPNLRYELHHKNCNLRCGTHGYGMDAYGVMSKLNLHFLSKLIITSVNEI